MIDWVKSSPEALWESTNHTRIHKKGFEANLQFDLHEWLGVNQPFTAFKAGYLYLQQERVDDNLISNYTLNHLRHKFTASLHHRLTDYLSLSWHFRWQERAGSYIQYIDGQTGEQVGYEPYAILDLKALYQTGRIDLFMHANNLFNTTHVDIGNIPQPGFWLSGGVSLKIN
jgi:iron complex outermembrane receptor protein